MPLGAVNETVLTPEQLAEAFGAFSSTAQVLERSYLALGQEVARLRRELLRRTLHRGVWGRLNVSRNLSFCSLNSAAFPADQSRAPSANWMIGLRDASSAPKPVVVDILV